MILAWRARQTGAAAGGAAGGAAAAAPTDRRSSVAPDDEIEEDMLGPWPKPMDKGNRWIQFGRHFRNEIGSVLAKCDPSGKPLKNHLHNDAALYRAVRITNAQFKLKKLKEQEEPIPPNLQVRAQTSARMITLCVGARSDDVSGHTRMCESRDTLGLRRFLCPFIRRNSQRSSSTSQRF